MRDAARTARGDKAQEPRPKRRRAHFTRRSSDPTGDVATDRHRRTKPNATRRGARRKNGRWVQAAETPRHPRAGATPRRARTPGAPPAGATGAANVPGATAGQVARRLEP